MHVNGVVEIPSEHMELTEIQVMKVVRSDGGTKYLSTLKPYFNGWFEVDLVYPGKYIFKVTNKELEADCQMPSATITLDAHAQVEVRNCSEAECWTQLFPSGTCWGAESELQARH